MRETEHNEKIRALMMAVARCEENIRHSRDIPSALMWTNKKIEYEEELKTYDEYRNGCFPG